MSRKDELLKLAMLFHSEARRSETRAVKKTLHRMSEYYQNEAAHASDSFAERRRPSRRLNRDSKQAA
jgi:hypothetical protein